MAIMMCSPRSRWSCGSLRRLSRGSATDRSTAAAAGADLFCIGPAGAVADCEPRFALPDGTAECVAPILQILPLQLLSLHLALARGGNPDAPRGLGKVTKTL